MDKPALTADLCARAIVAACASFGDDPLKAMAARSGPTRKGITVAATAVQQATGLKFQTVSRVFGVGLTTIANSRHNPTAPYQKALTATLLALGGARLVLAPVQTSRPQPSRPQAETISGQPDALLAPRPNLGRPVDVGVVKSALVSAPPAPALRLAPPARAIEPSPKHGRAAAGPKVVASMALDAPIATPVRGKVSEADRSLIDAALAAGKGRQVSKDDGTELVFDQDRSTYARLPRSELELVPGPGWKKTSKRQKAKAARPSHAPGVSS